MVSNIGIVKSVQSGDTVVLQSTLPPRAGEQPVEKTLSLAYVSAPRFKREGEEPGAFASREFLRKLLVGKEVQFGVLYTVPSTQRDYGLIQLYSGESVVDLAIAAGTVKVREEAGARGGKDDGEDEDGVQGLIERFKKLEAEARETHGFELVNASSQVTCAEGPISDPQEFVTKWKGKKVQAVLERVIAGDRYAVRLLLTPTEHRKVVVLAAGIRCPRSKIVDNSTGNETAGEEFGDEARQFVDQRLNQRTVYVEIFGLTPQNQLIAAVSHVPRGNIAEHLLAEGLARCEDFHSTLLGARMVKLRAAEKKAKDARKNMWKNYVVKRVDAANSFDAVVSRIIWVDQLIIKNKDGREQKISVSSIRGPKNTDPKQAPYQAEAKEFLRKKIIGKHVRVSIDGKKPASDGYEEKEAATVMFGDKNIALGLVEAGWASVIRHRRDDEDRSPIYDELLAAEERAQAAGVGMYSDKPPASAKIVDASETLQKAKTYLSFLQRQKRIPAIVDYVASGSRFKVIIPRENARLTFVLGGIRAPKTARNANETSEPFGQEAHDYVTKRCMQRDVEIDVENIDRVGGFIGTLYVGRENIAKALVEEGLAEVHKYSAEQGNHASDLFAAEARAKALKKGLWHNYDPEKEEEERNAAEKAHSSAAEEASAPVQKVRNYIDVVPTHVDSETLQIWLQTVTNGTQTFNTFTNSFRKYYGEKAHQTPIATAPKNNQPYAVKFMDDDQWYRATIRSVDSSSKTALVRYSDYGNEETAKWERIATLAPQFNFQTVPAQAQPAVLSFVQFPSNEYYRKQAAQFLWSVTGEDHPFVANVEFKDNTTGLMHVTLYDPKNSSSAEASVNADIIAAGLGMVVRKPKPFERAWPEFLEKFRALESEAQRERRGAYEYGDITED
ncbi:hypothetical protein DFH27DRAFT_563475 [Peziza echinospora]|nr:hypothetical protein DFH27DRAFT_563475 [Peziza echinospora]